MTKADDQTVAPSTKPEEENRCLLNKLY